MVFDWNFERTESREQKVYYYACRLNKITIWSWQWHDFIRMSSLVKRVWLPDRKVARLVSARDLINHFPEEYKVTRALLALHRHLHNELTDNEERKSPLLPRNCRFITTIIRYFNQKKRKLRSTWFSTTLYAFLGKLIWLWTNQTNIDFNLIKSIFDWPQSDATFKKGSKLIS